MALGRNDDGTLPGFTMPGCYPILYATADGGVLCPACANGENGSLASEAEGAPDDWRLVRGFIHWEGPPVVCAHCGKAVPSAYGGEEGEN